MFRLNILPKFKGTVFRGIKLDLSRVFKRNSYHVWWNLTSCTDLISGISEFLDIAGPRTLLDISTYRGVKISEHSIYPHESEVILLPGTNLKVIDQLDLGNGLVGIQMLEIPSQTEIAEALFHDKEAIEFWTALASERFEIPLEDFCEGMIRRARLPIVKSLDEDSFNSPIDIESYQKYWGLWLFAGGDEQTFSAYTKSPIVPPQMDCTITFHKFGLLLAWFGHFGKFMNELFNAIQLKIFYDDKMSSVYTAHVLLKNNVNNNTTWLIRCSPKRDFPYVISFIKVDSEGHVNVNHQRISLNPGTRQYTFSNLDTKTTFAHESITILVDIIKLQYNLGTGHPNDKFNLINDPELVRTQNACYVQLKNNYST